MEQQLGWRMIGPGMYIDLKHNLHFYVEEFLHAYHYADTPHNRTVAEDAMRRVAAEQFPGIPVHDV